MHIGCIFFDAEADPTIQNRLTQRVFSSKRMNDPLSTASLVRPEKRSVV